MLSQISFDRNRSVSTTVWYFPLIVLISLLYAIVLSWLIPVDGSIIDRANYIDYAERSNRLIDIYYSGGILRFLSNEPVWLIVNSLLRHFYSADVVVRIIIFFSSFTVSFLVLRSKPKYFIYLFLVLLFPAVIGKFVIHIRQGLAISFFLIGWFSKNRLIRWLFFGLSPFIHSSFLFILMLFGISKFSEKIKLAFDLRVLLISIVAFCVIVGLPFLALVSGARQANEYDFSGPEVSGVGFLYWSFILVLFWSQGKVFIRVNSFVITGLVFYLSTYFFLVVTARIFESILVLLLLIACDLNKNIKHLYYMMFVLFFCAIWVTRIDRPFLGWGL